MSWHFSQELVEAYSEDNCSDGKPFVPWKSMTSAPDDLCSGKMKDTCHASPYGMMFVPSTDGPGGELLTWFLAASLAKISQLPAKGPELMEKEAACGEKWQGSSMKYDLVSCSWKTRQHSLFGGLEEFSETWPRWGTMRNGECWGLPMWDRGIKENESGLWATPNANMQAEITPERALELGWVWKGTAWYTKDGVKKNSSLTHQVKIWPTPRACMTGAVTPERAKDKFNNLESVLAREMFPTPTNSMMTVGDMEQAKFAGTDKRRPDYATANKKFATPQARDFRSGQKSRWENPNRSRNLNDQIGGQLNPTWVEWLMGWPLGWTGCEPLETGKCHNAQLKHGEGF